MVIREATESDATQLVPLLAQMGYTLSLHSMKDRIAVFNKQGHKLMLAVQGTVIVGLIAFGCYEHFRLEGCCCHIDTLVVDKNHRGCGIGKQLIAVAEKYAADQGAKTIELITANHRKVTGTHSFYESLAYKDHAKLDYTYFGKEIV